MSNQTMQEWAQSVEARLQQQAAQIADLKAHFAEIQPVLDYVSTLSPAVSAWQSRIERMVSAVAAPPEKPTPAKPPARKYSEADKARALRLVHKLGEDDSALTKVCTLIGCDRKTLYRWRTAAQKRAANDTR